MVQHKMAVKHAGSRTDSNHRPRGKKATNPNIGRCKSSHSILENKRKDAIAKQNRLISKYILNSTFSVDNKEPHRLKRTLHHISRQKQLKSIEQNNRKIYSHICKTRSIIPNACELQRRWREKELLKQLSHKQLFAMDHILSHAVSRRLRKPTQIELVKSAKNRKWLNRSRSTNALSMSWSKGCNLRVRTNGFRFDDDQTRYALTACFCAQ